MKELFFEMQIIQAAERAEFYYHCANEQAQKQEEDKYELPF